MSTKSYLKFRTIRGTRQKWVGFGKPRLDPGKQAIQTPHSSSCMYSESALSSYWPWVQCICGQTSNWFLNNTEQVAITRGDRQTVLHCGVFLDYARYREGRILYFFLMHMYCGCFKCLDDWSWLLSGG